jgi:hypothetical protein
MSCAIHAVLVQVNAHDGWPHKIKGRTTSEIKRSLETSMNPPVESRPDWSLVAVSKVATLKGEVLTGCMDLLFQ